MKKKTKGIIFTVLFGGGLLFWATAATLPGIDPGNQSEITRTGTPMDNFPDEQRSQFCGTGEFSKSNSYVTEYKIPTPCTQPLAIVTDPQGNVWFAQTNTGNITKFDPKTESFTEYANPRLPPGFRSMIWGIDYSPDGTLWYTDEATDSIWQFDIQEETYQQMEYPRTGDSLPQRISIEGSNVIVNDFTGGKLTIMDPTASAEGVIVKHIPSPINGSVTGAFAVDSDDNVWYTNWIYQRGGILAKFNQEQLRSANLETKEQPIIDAIFQFPTGMSTPNGIAVGPQGKVWIADTSSSFFFSFDPNTENFTRYVTSTPHVSTYGNYSGVVKNPISRPYWVDFDERGRLVFNEQTGNRIGVFDPKTESLIEYMVPSKNPNWADCQPTTDCGLAQAFDFTIEGDKIWFTEWVENNIGVVHTSIPLPFDVTSEVEKIVLKKGEEKTFSITLEPNQEIHADDVSLTSATTSFASDLTVEHNAPQTFTLDETKIFSVTIKAKQSALSDNHKVLIGAQTDEVVISKYVTVAVE